MLRRGLRLVLQRLDASSRATAVCSSSLFRTGPSIRNPLRASECLTGGCSYALPPAACASPPADVRCWSPVQEAAASVRYRSAARPFSAESYPVRRTTEAIDLQGAANLPTASPPAREPRRSLSSLTGCLQLPPGQRGGLQGRGHGFIGLGRAGLPFSTALIRPPHLQQQRPRCAQAQLQPVPYTVDIFTGGAPGLLSCTAGLSSSRNRSLCSVMPACMHCTSASLPPRSISGPGASGLQIGP